jgi:hypothetical protein
MRAALAGGAAGVEDIDPTSEIVAGRRDRR